MPTYYFKTYRRPIRGATTGTLSGMKGLVAENLEAAEALVSGHFVKFDFHQNFAVLEDEYGKQIRYWVQHPRHT